MRDLFRGSIRSARLALCLTFALLLASVLVVLPGCATLSGKAPSPVAQITVQLATGKFIELDRTPEGRMARAVKLAQAIDVLKATAGRSQITTVAVLQAQGMKLIANSNLGVSDRLLAQSLLAAVVTELNARVGAGGVIADGNRLAIDTVLGWVRDTATAYGAT